MADIAKIMTNTNALVDEYETLFETLVDIVTMNVESEEAPNRKTLLLMQIYALDAISICQPQFHELLKNQQELIDKGITTSNVALPTIEIDGPNDYRFMQDMAFYSGMPVGKYFVRYSGENKFVLTAPGHGVKEHYGNGAIWVSFNNLPSELKLRLVKALFPKNT